MEINTQQTSTLLFSLPMKMLTPWTSKDAVASAKREIYKCGVFFFFFWLSEDRQALLALGQGQGRTRCQGSASTHQCGRNCPHPAPPCTSSQPSRLHKLGSRLSKPGAYFHFTYKYKAFFLHGLNIPALSRNAAITSIE